MPQEPLPNSDAVLVSRMIAGDRDAFAVLFRRHERSVYRFALQMTGAGDLADDVTQEVFMALARGGSRYVPAQGSLST
jgi:RNA polymerase sigma-70 factor, ECF subfamily